MPTVPDANWDWLSVDGGGYTDAAKFRWFPDIGYDLKVAGGVIPMDGRKYPVLYAGEQTTEEWDVGWVINPAVDGQDAEAKLRGLIDTNRGKTLLWQLRTGETRYVACFGCRVELMKPGPRRKVMFKLQAVDPQT
jgi:hypothetical protein